MEPTPPIAGCQACGACCFSQLPTFVRVSGKDWSRLGPATNRVAHFIGNRAYMRLVGGHCAALRIGRDLTGNLAFFCTVYENRPEICRNLDRGSPACLAELELKAGRAEIAIMVT
jgi:Fe-S-cluster containining protein